MPTSNTSAESGSSAPPSSERRSAGSRASAFPPWLRHFFVLAIVAASYVICLWLVFPGYFDPLYPLHSDFYTPPGLSVRNPSLWTYLEWPRPIGYLTADLLGRLGLQGYILSLVVVTLVNVALTVELVRRIIGKEISLLLVAAYCFFLFSHPQFYVNYVHDTLATLSYFYLVAGMLAWYVYRNRSSKFWLGACVACFILLAFTKETYFASAVCLWAGQVFVCRGQGRKVAGYLLAVLISLEAFGLYVNLTSTEPFIQLQSEASSPYQMSFALSSLASVFGFYTKHLLNLPVVLAILASLAVLYRQKRLLFLTGGFVLAGFAAILPHTPLPHHLDPQYSWTAAALVMSPLLFVSFHFEPGWTKRHTALAGGAATLIALSIWANRPAYAENRWIVEQERINRNIISSYPQIKSNLDSGEKILVTGLRTPVHPFYDSFYIRSEFGAVNQWTVLVPRGRDERHEPPVTLARAENVNAGEFDRIFAFGEQGRLVGIRSRQDLPAVSHTDEPAISKADLILFPALRPIQSTLTQDPNQWHQLLQAGLVFWDWGMLRKAKYHFQRAAEANEFENPYPLFYLGQIHEWEGNYDGALDYYTKAIARGDEENPAFRTALEQLKQKVAEHENTRPEER